jgi:hypothetical protein
MGRAFDTITEQMRSFVSEQHVFFVSTAPSNGGHINLSPKGYDSFRILGDNQVCYLDLTGSGAETISHVRENGRITFMFCAFTGKPNIVRFYGQGRVVRPGDTEWNELHDLFEDSPGERSIIVAEIDRTSTACGYAVPFMDYVEDRQRLADHWDHKTDDELTEYWATKNSTSIDGLPAVE